MVEKFQHCNKVTASTAFPPSGQNAQTLDGWATLVTETEEHENVQPERTGQRSSRQHWQTGEEEGTTASSQEANNRTLVVDLLLFCRRMRNNRRGFSEGNSFAVNFSPEKFNLRRRWRPKGSDP